MDENCNEVRFDSSSAKPEAVREKISRFDRVLSISAQVFLLSNDEWVQLCKETVLVHVVRDTIQGVYMIFSGDSNKQYIPMERLSVDWKLSRASKKFITITFTKKTYGIGFSRARDAQECMNQFAWLNCNMAEEASIGSEPGENIGANTPVVKVSEALINGPLSYDRECAPLRMMPGFRDLLKIESKLDRPGTQMTDTESPARLEYPRSPRRSAPSLAGSPIRQSVDRRPERGYDDVDRSFPVLTNPTTPRRRNSDHNNFLQSHYPVPACRNLGPEYRDMEYKRLSSVQENSQTVSSAILTEYEPDVISDPRSELPVGDMVPPQMPYGEFNSNRPRLDRAPMGRSTPVNMHHIVQQQQMLMDLARHSTPFAQLFMTGLRTNSQGRPHIVDQEETIGSNTRVSGNRGQDMNQTFYTNYRERLHPDPTTARTPSSNHFESEHHSSNEEKQTADAPSSLNDLITAFEPLGFDNSVIHSPRKRPSM